MKVDLLSVFTLTLQTPSARHLKAHVVFLVAGFQMDNSDGLMAAMF